MKSASETIYEIMCEIYANGDEDQEVVSQIATKYINKIDLAEVVEGHSFCIKLQRAFENVIFGGFPVTKLLK